MVATFTRDAAMTALIFGFFASSWFGCAQERPPGQWRGALVAASVVSLLIAVAGAFFAWQHWSDGTSFTPSTRRTYGLIVGLEVALCALGAGALAALGKAEYTSAWIALVVGLHLFPLAPLLQYPFLNVTAALISSGVPVAVLVATSRALTVSAVTGVVVGTILLISALFSLVTVGL